MNNAEYSLFDTLPKAYKNVLPSAEDTERRIGLSARDEGK
jgi:hypothetical protein